MRLYDDEKEVLFYLIKDEVCIFRSRVGDDKKKAGI